MQRQGDRRVVELCIEGLRRHKVGVWSSEAHCKEPGLIRRLGLPGGQSVQHVVGYEPVCAVPPRRGDVFVVTEACKLVVVALPVSAVCGGT